MSGIYVHIPFCKSRCIYCGFYSTTLEKMQDRYVKALTNELSLRSDYISARVRTIYIGGGTPSILTEENMTLLCQALLKRAGEGVDEFTVECNPDDVTEDYAAMLVRNGVNRVSMGAQSFSDQRLRFLRRRHKADDVERAVSVLRKAGIKNISIDLMFGFPQETLTEWESDLDKAISFGVEHISAYSLMYEEGTPLYTMLENGKIEEIDEDLSRAMYDSLINKLTSAGYEHYEISNFSRQGYHSRHNSSYWDGTEYLGIGAAAHSYNGNSRQWNISDARKYTDILSTNSLPDVHTADIFSHNNLLYSFIEEKETLSDTEKYNDIVTTALRTRKGINLSILKESDRSFLLTSAADDIKRGNLILEKKHLHLTIKGLYISDAVMVNLIK